MNANIRAKYIGSNPIFTVNQDYQVLALDMSTGSTVRFGVLDDNGVLQVGSFGGGTPDWTLVSITYPGEVQIYP